MARTKRPADGPDAMSNEFPEIPYGRAHFRGLRLDGCLYVDKTRFLRELERQRYVFFIRPRRFGKSCWLSMLESYYNRYEEARFDAVFGGTDIGRRPTADRSRYAVLRFDFSAFNDKLDLLEDSFEGYCNIRLEDALDCNPDLFPNEAKRRILSPPRIDGKLNELFRHTSRRDIPLYILIDEYDNFANTVLARHGEAAYHHFTHGEGFYRSFFATLKAGTVDGGLDRLFITGVSPITIDDVTSGFNIGRNLSLDARFNEMLGFTEDEVRDVLETYRGLGVLDRDPDAVLEVMREWYDGYRFSRHAERDVYNTDMVLYYLSDSVPNRTGPDDLIDQNVRIDYDKLRHLLVTARRLNGNFDLLRDVMARGSADADPRSGFPLTRLGERENFFSLLHYFGLLSIRPGSAGAPRLGIPNQTVRRLMYGYLRDAYRDVGVFNVDVYALERLTRAMAFAGEWRPVLEFLRAAVAEQTSVRDYLGGERLAQGFVAAYLNVIDYFVVHTELALGGGYADICLEPNAARFPDIRHGFLIELKYVKRGEGAGRVDAAFRAAAEQLRRYLADRRLARRHPSVRFAGLAVVFHGAQMVRCEQVAGPEEP